MQEGEDATLAKPATEDLNAVLQLLEYNAVGTRWRRAALAAPLAPRPRAGCDCRPPTAIPSQIQELSLSGNQLRAGMLRRRLRFRVGDTLNSAGLEDGGAREALHGVQDTDLAALRASAEVVDCKSECGIQCTRADVLGDASHLLAVGH